MLVLALDHQWDFWKELQAVEAGAASMEQVSLALLEKC